MPPYTRSRRSTTFPVPDAAAGIIPSPLYQIGVMAAFRNNRRDRPTPYSRPPPVQRHSPPPCGTRFTLVRRHRSNGGHEAPPVLTTPIPPPALVAAATAGNDEEEDVLMHTPEEEDVVEEEEDVIEEEEEEEEEDVVEEEEGWIMVPADLDDEILEYLTRSPTYYETDYEDEEEEEEEEEEEFVLPSPGVGGLMCRIPMDHIDYDDMYYDEGLPGYVVDEFLRTASCADSAADGGGEELCVVCQDYLCQEDDRKVGILECGHRFHADCIGEWLLVKNVCPLCKAFGIGCFT